MEKKGGLRGRCARVRPLGAIPPPAQRRRRINGRAGRWGCEGVPERLQKVLKAVRLGWIGKKRLSWV